MDRQILWDCHMHSSFSADSDTPMEVMIHRAVETGLQGITFTEHLDPDYPVTPDNLDFSLKIFPKHSSFSLTALLALCAKLPLPCFLFLQWY